MFNLMNLTSIQIELLHIMQPLNISWLLFVIVIVIVNSRFLERPQKRSRRNQRIHRRLTKTKSIGSVQDPESQAGRQSDGYGGWCLELRRGGRYRDDDESRYDLLKSNVFSLE